MKTETKDVVQARLTIHDMKGTTEAERKSVASWLRQIADEMETLESEAYVKNPRWTLYK